MIELSRAFGFKHGASALTRPVLSALAAIAFSSPALAAAPTATPLLTADQRQVDELALSLLNDPGVKAARADGLKLWSTLPASKLDGAQAELGGAIDEAVYSALRSVAANDPAAPKVVWVSGPGYAYGKTKVPGSRFAGDNPDRIYRSVAVDPSHSYEIRGQRSATPSNEAFSFEAIPTISAVGTPIGTLSSKDVDVAADGSFTITADATPANGRRNHLTLPPGTTTVLIRDTLADWSRQLPNQLTVRRVDGGAAPARTSEQLHREAADEVARVIRANVRWLGYGWATPPNRPEPHLRKPEDGVPGAIAAQSRFSLKADEALVVTVDPASARYVGLQLTDPWYRSIRYWDRTSSLSSRQAKANSDGSFTYVISPKDPGYYNWASTDGLREGLILIRVEDFAHTPDPQQVIREAKVVSLAELSTALPKDAQRVTPAQRAEQLAVRQAGYELRVAQ